MSAREQQCQCRDGVDRCVRGDATPVPAGAVDGGKHNSDASQREVPGPQQVDPHVCVTGPENRRTDHRRPPEWDASYEPTQQDPTEDELLADWREHHHREHRQQRAGDARSKRRLYSVDSRTQPWVQPGPQTDDEPAADGQRDPNADPRGEGGRAARFAGEDLTTLMAREMADHRKATPEEDGTCRGGGDGACRRVRCVDQEDHTDHDQGDEPRDDRHQWHGQTPPESRHGGGRRARSGTGGERVRDHRPRIIGGLGLRSAARVGTIAAMSTTPPARARVFSGMRPTGELHIGHLFGALGNWVRMQEEAECIYCVVDLHALTTGYEDVQGIRRNGQLMVADWLAVGIDPERSIMFRQSDVSEHAELATMLGMITPLSWLERVPSYKGQLQELGESIDTFGFLGYPLLQTADIILYKATEVPVGQDQLPHLELAREIVRRFNNLYGTVFPEPKARLAEVPLIMGVDNRKMSKSYGNAITIGATDEEIDRLVGSMVTDPQRIRKTDPGRPEVCNVWSYHKLFDTPQPELDAIYIGCTTAQLGCVQDKRALAETIKTAIRPIRARRAGFLEDPDRIDEILADGARRARAIAAPVLAEAKAAMGL